MDYNDVLNRAIEQAEADPLDYIEPIRVPRGLLGRPVVVTEARLKKFKRANIGYPSAVLQKYLTALKGRAFFMSWDEFKLRAEASED